jgi:hypothetical protein
MGHGSAGGCTRTSVRIAEEDERRAGHDRGADERQVGVLDLARADTARCLQSALDDVPEAMDASRAQAAAKGVERQLAVELDMPIPDEVERLGFLAETAGLGTVKCTASVKRLLAPATACSLPSSGRLLSYSSVEFPDLPGGTGQVGVIQPGRHIVFFGLCEESAEPQRLFEECEGDVERLLPLLDPERELPATLARTDVIVAAHAEGIEAEGLLLLARDGDHDGGPFDAVRLPAEQLPVGVEHYMQMRPGIDLMPSVAVLGHGLLHPLRL